MPAPRYIADRTERLPDDRVRVWFDLGGGQLRSAVTRPWLLDEANVRRVGEALAAEHHPPIRRVYSGED